MADTLDLPPLEQRILETFRTYLHAANGGAVGIRYYPSTNEIWGKVEGLPWNELPASGQLEWTP